MQSSAGSPTYGVIIAKIGKATAFKLATSKVRGGFATTYHFFILSSPGVAFGRDPPTNSCGRNQRIDREHRHLGSFEIRTPNGRKT